MATLVGLVGEMIVNLTNNSVHVHDGVTEGGFELGRADASNIQNATGSQNGRMTIAQVLQLDAATAANAVNAAAIAAETAARIAADSAIDGDLTIAEGKITNLELGKFALNTEPVLLSFYQATIPTGWTLNTSFDDRVPIVETTQAQGANTGGGWTITGLSADSHTHTYTPAGTNGTSTVNELRGDGLGGILVAMPSHTHTFTGSLGSTSGPSTTNVSSGGGWRPNFVKVLVLSRSAWSV